MVMAGESCAMVMPQVLPSGRAATVSRVSSCRNASKVVVARSSCNSASGQAGSRIVDGDMGGIACGFPGVAPPATGDDTSE
jgi:hypothetical protein